MTETQRAHGSTPLRLLSHGQWIVALGGWTLFVWVQRIGNVLGADDLDSFDRTWRIAVAVGFVIGGGALVGGVLAGRKRGGLAPWVSTLAVWLAAIGVAWWVVRGSQILVGDWDLSFKAVHTVLAAVVVGLSVMVWRTRGYDPQHHG